MKFFEERSIISKVNAPNRCVNISNSTFQFNRLPLRERLSITNAGKIQSFHFEQQILINNNNQSEGGEEVFEQSTSQLR